MSFAKAPSHRRKASDEEELEDSCWVPLDPPATSSGRSEADRSATSNPSLRTLQLSRPNNTSSNAESIQILQRRVQMRHHLHQRLVQHPIQLLWSHFLWHLAQEFWKLDARIRVAMLFLLLGSISRIFLIMTWYLFYPRMILLFCIMVGSAIYLNPNAPLRYMERFLDALMHLPDRIPETLERLNPQKARILCVAMLFFPTLLQVRTICFLSNVNANGGGLVWNSMVVLLMAGTSAMYLIPKPTKTTRDIFQTCLLTLYGSALWIVVKQWKVMAATQLAAPFFLSTGTLLLSYDEHDNMEWFSHMVRNALRLTLRDILASVGTQVQEDEMLQLAMLRWIVDYWNYTPQQTQPQTAGPQAPHATQESPPQAYPPTTPVTNPMSQHELEWHELLPMLNAATDQMSSEVHSLQHHGDNPAENSTSAETGTTPNRRNSTRPADDPLKNLHNMLASMNVDDRAKPAVAAYKRNIEEFPPSRELALFVSIARRCPATLTFLWQLLVASMFQSYATSFYIFLILVPLMGLEVLRIQAWVVTCEAVSRILNSGEKATTATDASSDTKPTGTLIQRFPEADPMTILLCGDDDLPISVTTTNGAERAQTQAIRIPTLLIVWNNMKKSVGALEVSLTAARCVQTGVVAVEFAQNIMSLAEFGTEVSKHGWMHGLTLIAKEVIFDHQGDINSQPRGARKTFTNAAVSAVQNGQRVARNIEILAQENNNISQFVAPIVGLFGFLGNIFQNKNQNDPEGGHAGDSETTPSNASDDVDSGQGPTTTTTTEDAANDWLDMNNTIIENAETRVQADESAPMQQGTSECECNPPRTQNKTDKTSSDVSEKQVIIAAKDQVDVKAEAPNDEDENAVARADSKDSETRASTDAITDSAIMGDSETRGEKVTESSPESVGNNLDQATTTLATETITSRSRDEEIRSELNGSIEDKDTSVSESNAIELDPSARPTKKARDRDDEQVVAPVGIENDNLEDLSSVMELIAEAFDKNFIDESEKNEFCLKLSTNGHNKQFVSGMKVTLQGLLLENEQSVSDAAIPAIEITTGALSRCMSPDELGGAEAGLPVSESMMSDDGWSPIVESVASEEAAIQPLDYSERLADAVRTRDDLSTPQLHENRALLASEDEDIPTVDSAGHKSDDDNMWVKVGGGLAVVGAIVGGAFLAMHHDNANNQRRENQTNSNVTIERLDDENGNEWEAKDTRE